MGLDVNRPWRRGKLLCKKQIEELIDFAPKIKERDPERRRNGGEKHKQGGERLRPGEVQKPSRFEIGEEHPSKNSDAKLVSGNSKLRYVLSHGKQFKMPDKITLKHSQKASNC